MQHSERITSLEKIKEISDLARVDLDVICGEPVVVMETQREDVGLGFEPRIRVHYDVIRADSNVTKNEVLLILQKDGATVSSAYMK
ncbi:MAG: hypothetical protein Q7R96_02305 [Nanoarchaeota archaeon]|nr:hypothetical protein [Nanoarchaeota archaeon]